LTSTRVRLTFPAELVRQPIVAQLVRRFDVLPNIRRAEVREDTGWMVCELDGDPGALHEALDWLRQLGVAVDQVDHPLES
jgi:L-aspartate semialdehyde sulfurtransferase ferredoxin